MRESAFGSPRSIEYKYGIFMYVHTSGTFELSDHLSDNFQKNGFSCAFCTAHIFEALFWKNATPSVGKDVILHICAKGFVLKTRTTEIHNFPGRKFASNFDSYRHCLLRLKIGGPRKCWLHSGGGLQTIRFSQKCILRCFYKTTLSNRQKR